MSDDLRHPRLVAAVRALLYATAGAVALGVGLLAVVTVGFVVSAGGLALALTGNAHLVAVFVLTGLVLATSAGLLWGLKAAVERAESEVRAWDRERDPVEDLKARYVDGDVDEREMERRLDHELRGDDDPAPREAPPAPRGERVRVRSGGEDAPGGDEGASAGGDSESTGDEGASPGDDSESTTEDATGEDSDDEVSVGDSDTDADDRIVDRDRARTGGD